MTAIRPITDLLAVCKQRHRIILDSNILIALVDQNHADHTRVFDTVRLIDEGNEDTSLYYVQPCRLELLNYWRRKTVTDFLDARIAAGKPFLKRFQKVLEQCLLKIEEEGKFTNDPYLRDWMLKRLRDVLINFGPPKEPDRGKKYWQSLCGSAMAGQFTKLTGILDSLEIRYAKFADEDVYPVSKKDFWPKWDNTFQLIERFCLSSNDAAILNMIAGGHDLDAFISNDYDMLIAAENGAISDEITGYTFRRFPSS